MPKDPSRAYDSGATAIALSVARQALSDAFVHAMRHEDMDGPLISAISRAQTEVQAACKLPVDWEAKR